MTAFTDNLQPLSMSQLLDRAIRLYRSNFLIFVGIVALAQIPATAVNMLGLWLAPAPDLAFNPSASLTDFWLEIAQSSGFGNNPWLWLGQLVSLLLVQLATAALTKAVAENYLGHKIGLFEAYQTNRPSWPDPARRRLSQHPRHPGPAGLVGDCALRRLD
jgi:hypothetical protein